MTTYKTMNGTVGAYGHGDYTDYLPTLKKDGTYRPGKWLPKVQPVLCESGYHGCRNLEEVLEHTARDLYEIEHRGAEDTGNDKAAWEQIRFLRPVLGWNERNLRLFSVDCARSVAHTIPDAERGLYDAILDIYVAYAEYGEEWAVARNVALAVARDMAWDAAQDEAWAAERDAMLANLATYLDGTNEWCVEVTQ